MKKQNNKILLVALGAIVLLFVVAMLIYSNNDSTKMPRTDEYENATVVLDIPAGEEGDAPGGCKLSLISKSSAYPVEISDISTFYEFSDDVAGCENGKMTIYSPDSQEMQNVSYVSFVLSGTSEGIAKSDVTTGILYTVNSSFTGDVLNVSINIESDEDADKSEVVRSILLSEIGSLFNGNGSYALLDSYESLEDLGLTLSN